MKLKMDDAGHVVVADGKPVYVHDDGRELPFDASHTVATITRLNGEAKGFRERAEGAESKLKTFGGIDDPEAARNALGTVKNLKDGDLVTAGKVEEIKTAAHRAAEEQVQAAAKRDAEKIKALTGERDKLQGDLYGEKVGGAFSRSKFISEKVAVPGDMLQAMFGKQFKIEEGKVVGFDGAGNKLYSRAKPGEIADFDEALEMMVDGYPSRDSVLKGTGSTGSGARHSPAGGGSPGKRSVPRAEYDRLSPAEQISLGRQAAKGEVQITD